MINVKHKVDILQEIICMKKLTAQIMRIQLNFADTIRVDKYGKIKAAI